MKLLKVSTIMAGLLAVVGSSTFAGQIDSSSITIAKEVVWNNAQVLRAPSKSYSFVGDINAATNTQQLQLQWSLTQGTWAVGAASTGAIFTAVNVLTPITTGTDKLITATSQAGSGAGFTAGTNNGLPAGTVINAFVTGDKKTLVFNITIPAGATHLGKGVAFTINADANANPVVAKNNAGINGLFAVAGEVGKTSAVMCKSDDSSINIAFKHFTTNNGDTTVITSFSQDSEHERPNATNVARYLSFVQNIKLAVSGGVGARTSAASLNTAFSTVMPATVQSGATVTVPTPSVAGNSLSFWLGKVSGVASGGVDLNYTTTYALAGTSSVAAPLTNAGGIDLKDVTFNINTGGAVWPAGTIVRAADAAGTVLGTSTLATAGSNAAMTVTGTGVVSAILGTATTAGVYFYATFPGNVVIPNTSGANMTATINKLLNSPTDPQNDPAEQNNACNGNLSGVGSGIQIDVRNYATFAKFGATGPRSTLRLINNSETNTADIYAQMIYADGTYGASGLITTLAPRAVFNINNDDLESRMRTPAATSNPFGSKAVGYAATGGGAVVNAGSASTGDRVRIISNSGTTLRVQSYIILGSTVLDTSNAQGVDFENSRDAVPTFDAQPISQDAINGLSK